MRQTLAGWTSNDAFASPKPIFRHILDLANSTAGRALACTVLIWLLIFASCKQLLWRDPHAAFFREDGVYDLGYSKTRQEEAHEYIDRAGGDDGAFAAPGGNAKQPPVVCAAVTTFKREPINYLNETVGTMLEGLTSEERSALDVRLLFAHVDPTIHVDWNRSWLKAVDHWSGYNVSDAQLDQIREWEDGPNYYAKGVYDYIYVLRECLDQTSAPYIAVFEDDIIFADGWLAKTFKALADLRETSDPWLYLRLFYTETALMWQESVDYWYGHKLVTFGLAMSATLGGLLLIRRTVRPSRRFLDNLTIAVVVLVTVPMFIALIFMIGKYNLMPLNGLERMDRYGCCTQALIYSRASATQVVDMLQERGSGQTDALIEEYGTKNGLAKYALAPQVVQHVGIVSSRDNLEANTRSTWAFWFETQDAGKLKKEHMDLAKAGIWRATSEGG
ncbi:hypothetical protein KC331_g1030 [Hortaea werneckii]|uniref:Integral membrane protein n=1 Tax=Hortaea werneckii TaxID=91943 RepID=A0A3M7D964_HORWE|nr:hypothetical protein KC331_g1030 [Hortaea werneckii]RMY60683.1 hypothetical protein D0865_01395 [Hortaea werneckii]